MSLLDRLEDEGSLHSLPAFVDILSYSLGFLGLTAKKLALDEGISRSAISKWVNGFALPSRPTQKVVLQWIRRELAKSSLESPDAVSDGSEADDHEPPRERQKRDA